MWISVKDRLPEAFQRVACQVMCLSDWIGGFHDGDLWNIDHYGELAAHGYAGWKVVRWLEVTPPPEVEK